MKSAHDERFVFQHWIDLISHWDKRLYYRDQTPESCMSLLRLARDFRPTVIVELGTLSGMSLRTWIKAAPDARIKAIDLNFEPLEQSKELSPVDLSRVERIQANILYINFSQLWKSTDRVLLFVDAHDLPDVPIMRHVLHNALPHMPAGSLVVVDDIWHTPEDVTGETAMRVFTGSVLHEIDELQLFEPHYAPYHMGGTFWGFIEVQPLLHYVNEHGITLDFEPGGKHVSFTTDTRGSQADGFSVSAFRASCGKASYHPLQGALFGDPIAETVLPNVMRMYARGDFTPAAELLSQLQGSTPGIKGSAYAVGLILARMGEARLAAQALELELQSECPHPNAARLRADLLARFFRHRAVGKKRAPGVTFFAVPKPFTGHEEILQRNAIESWLKIAPASNVILFGNDEGVAEACAEYGLRHVPDVLCNEFGTPLVDDIFFKAQAIAGTEVLLYVNADIILFDDLTRAVDIVAGQLDNFLMVGRRWDYDLTSRIDVSQPGWAEELKRDVAQKGTLHGIYGMDYFAFRPGLWPGIPPFALGRYFWDTWFLFDAITANAQVVDCSKFVTIVHQNHGYKHHPGEVERNRNRLLLGEPAPTTNSTEHAPLILNAQGKLMRRDRQ